MVYNEEQYTSMHDNLLTWRNKIIAHLDLKDAYDVKFNEEYFSKIPIQCKSIAKSIIEVFEEEAKTGNQIELKVAGNEEGQLRSLKDIADYLSGNLASKIDNKLFNKMLNIFNNDQQDI